MEISEIRIKNVKGFKEPENIIKLDNTIKSGKVNVLVAPNGWGKSSLTAAFDGLKKTIQISTFLRLKMTITAM